MEVSIDRRSTNQEAVDINEVQYKWVSRGALTTFQALSSTDAIGKNVVRSHGDDRSQVVNHVKSPQIARDMNKENLAD